MAVSRRGAVWGLARRDSGVVAAVRPDRCHPRARVDGDAAHLLGVERESVPRLAAPVAAGGAAADDAAARARRARDPGGGAFAVDRPARWIGDSGAAVRHDGRTENRPANVALFRQVHLNDRFVGAPSGHRGARASTEPDPAADDPRERHRPRRPRGRPRSSVIGSSTTSSSDSGETRNRFSFHAQKMCCVAIHASTRMTPIRPPAATTPPSRARGPTPHRADSTAIDRMPATSAASTNPTTSSAERAAAPPAARRLAAVPAIGLDRPLRRRRAERGAAAPFGTCQAAIASRRRIGMKNDFHAVSGRRRAGRARCRSRSGPDDRHR